jgi:nucleoid DNA-binding protein
MDKSKLDKEFPIILAKIEPVIDRVCKRYPTLNKIQITIMTKSFFERIRYLLVKGETLSINNFVGRLKLMSFYRNRHGKDIIHIKAKISTPKVFKN